jgi:hypothetical protein
VAFSSLLNRKLTRGVSATAPVVATQPEFTPTA